MSTQPTKSHYEEAYMSLMRGLSDLDLRGSSVPCDLVLTGDHAFPLAMNSRGQVLMAASLYGRGRIVVLGHESYLTTCPALVKNALTWLRGDGSDNLSVGVHKDVKVVAENLRESGFRSEVVGAFSDNPGVGVYVTDAYSVGADPKDLVAFMKAGGGVLIAGQAWHWATTHPNKMVMLQFPGNNVSAVAGIYFTANYGEAENIPVRPQIPSSWKAVDVRKNFKEDLEILLKGVSEFDIHQDHLLSEVMVHGPLAFPIGTTDSGQAFLAGAYYGRGRVIVVTHECLLQSQPLDSFWNNAYHWLDQGRNGVVGYVPDVGIFSGSGLKREKTQFRKDLSVFVCSAYSDKHAEEIQEFVAEGGGLVVGGHAWYFPEKPGNNILNKMGLTLLADTVKSGVHKVPEPSQAKLETFHFRRLLRRFLHHVTEGAEFTDEEEKHLKKLGKQCAIFLKMKAHDSFSYTQILTFLTDILKKIGMPEMDDENSVKTPRDYFRLVVGSALFRFSPDPDAILFLAFKEIPKLPVVHDQRIRISAQTAENKEWISTGLYLSPGMRTNMTFPAKIVDKKWMVQIGCQTDHLPHEELQRAPRVYERFPVTSEVMQVWNPWGGLIYLVAPRDIKVEGEEVVVQMAVTAPYYKSGVTTAADWSSLRTAPAPWAEFEFDNIILTVPSRYVRDLENPDEVATLWDDIMKAVADLAVIPHKFPRKERIVADVQISAGWMHAGYPIMIHFASAAEMFRPHDARTGGLWGQIHELGHHHQGKGWDLPPNTGEATNNLWSVYVHEEVLGLDRAKAHGDLSSENRKKRVKTFVDGGRKLNDWHVWVALETYLQLQEGFGWDAFKKVFGAYHNMGHVSYDQKGKMNLFAETFSQTVGMDLTEFFKAWGWDIEPATEEKLSNLPPWSDHPMAQYK